MAARVLADEGFALNPKKTRTMGPRQRRQVTGLVVSDGGGIGIGRQQKRRLRAVLHSALTPGAGVSEKERNRRLAHFEGWVAFLAAGDPVGAEQLRGYRARLETRLGLHADL